MFEALEVYILPPIILAFKFVRPKILRSVNLSPFYEGNPISSCFKRWDIDLFLTITGILTIKGV